MKKTLPLSSRLLLLACSLFLLAGFSAQASSTFVVFSVDMATNIANGTFTNGDTVEAHGSFNGFGALTLVQEPGTTIYTNTANDTVDANGGQLQYKFVIDGSNWENPATGQNRSVILPTTSGATLVLPTPFFSDAGAPVTNEVTFQVDVSQQINLGNFIPGTSSVELRGLLDGWAGGVDTLTNDPTILVTNQFGLVTSNVFVGTFPVVGSPASAEAYKYVIQPGTQWDSPSALNEDGGQNRFFANVAQTLPVANFSDQVFAPLASLTFSVDMSVVSLTDTNFDPSSVQLWGDFNGWANGINLTNNPAAQNTNIYSSVISDGVGAGINYQYRYTQLSSGNTVYDHFNGANGGNNNRFYLVPNVKSTNVPAVFFNDAELDDYLTKDTPVTFTLDMHGAVGTDGHTFDPNSDVVFINGQFANWYAWFGGITPAPAPAGFQLTENPIGSLIYSNTVIVPKGTPVSFSYKYGIGVSGNPGPNDDESGFGSNHFRVVRSLAVTPYAMPTDTFGNQYNEPFFSSTSTGGANLKIGAPLGSTVPVTWLGRPGAHLQVKSDLASGAWQDIPATDGATWNAGFNSINGFVSQTNMPATSGKVFVRVVKP